jgi:beta-lactamase class A
MRKFLRVLLILLVIAAALLTLPYLRYRQTAGVVPAWMRLGGMEVSGLTAEQVTQALRRGFEEPVAAYYDDQRILLRPQTVGFAIDAEAMIAEAQKRDSVFSLVRYLAERSLNRQPRTVDVPLRYTLDAAALDAWLTEIAASHDRSPQPPQPIVQTMSIAPGKPGQALDMEASRSQVLATLTDPNHRTVNLAVAETPAPPIDIQALGALLQARLDEFPGIASLYLHHLPTGEEITINADVAYAGTSTLKIPILEQVYRILDAPPGVETSKIISETMMHSGNFTANLMLGKIGDGDWDVGVQRMNQAFKTLGMTNTFMAAPYDRKMAVPPRIVTEANSRTDLNTQPDPYMQTTARDIGTSLQMLVACSEGGGTLIAAYGDRITPAECQQALDFMSLNEMKEMLVGGLPAGAKYVHKHGYVPDTHGDVAAIWGPAGPYVLSVFLYRPTWLEWGISNPTLQELAKTTWDFFDKYGVAPRTEN